VSSLGTNLRKFDRSDLQTRYRLSLIETTYLEYFGAWTLEVFILNLKPRSKLNKRITQVVHKFWRRLLSILHQLQIDNLLLWKSMTKPKPIHDSKQIES
jgi:hypothetical protein